MLKGEGLISQLYNSQTFLTSKVFHCSPEFLAECVSTTLDSRFFLLLELRFDLRGRVFVPGFSLFSSVAIVVSLDGSSGGASGHGVRFDGTVTSIGVSMIHLHDIEVNFSNKQRISATKTNLGNYHGTAQDGKIKNTCFVVQCW